MKKSKKETNLGVVYVEEDGLVKVSYGGKVLLLLLTGVLSLWVLVLILVNWDTFTKKVENEKVGKAVVYLATISMSLLVLTVFEKHFALKFYINSSRQIAILIYFVTVFILIFNFEPGDIKSGTENLKVYENPVQMTYIYILFYMISFYILHNYTVK